ncbi:hypothetical protein [Actinoplanes couchii]|uniref:Peptidoglycan binding-like domain-containing protein n=1 Tax=Actinoplanes couchii TaxID=403638 RepID=A0ABQ3XDG4_9ACTN|nr:hypothetical protein [Actinoplanes couchii]MDR6317052.1 peptidoglycan hydrolase-like protein with peptidoglycan-binding domain [Actinoplanes couchii]GID56547.1 hypothetical protein Aco03nite_049510 [Actinoplanes couchii]
MGLPPFSTTTWPLPRGHYFGLISGPAASRGGFTADEKTWVREIQRQLIRKRWVPGVTDPDSGWADGLFEKPTADAVARFQRAEMPGTKFFGQIWADDFARLFTPPAQPPSPRRDKAERDQGDIRLTRHNSHDADQG